MALCWKRNWRRLTQCARARQPGRWTAPHAQCCRKGLQSGPGLHTPPHYQVTVSGWRFTNRRASANATKRSSRPAWQSTIEPGVYLEGFGGIRIEDTVVVTERGCEILTPTSKELYII